MRPIGYSTGAINPANLEKAVQDALSLGTKTLEISALRFDEFDSALATAAKLPSSLELSFHVPSSFTDAQEVHITEQLMQEVAKRPMNLILHPDAIHQHARWRKLNGHVCVENMDHRKPTGRDAAELDKIFALLPEARMCFDIGHAHVIDRTLSLAFELLTKFSERIVEIHASEVTDSCKHVCTTWATRNAYHRLEPLLPSSATVIIESEARGDAIYAEVHALSEALNNFDD